jgi:hypothetical protein
MVRQDAAPRRTPPPFEALPVLAPFVIGGPFSNREWSVLQKSSQVSNLAQTQAGNRLRLKNTGALPQVPPDLRSTPGHPPITP